MRPKRLPLSAFCFAFAVLSCGGSTDDSVNRGMTSVSPSGGTPATSLGGIAATGGRDSGVAAGGVAAGGVATGGMPTGGVATGSASTSSTNVSDPCAVTNVLSGGIKHCSKFESGVSGGYQWTLGANQDAGCLTTYENAGAAFSATWDNSTYFYAEADLEFDDTEPYEEHGVLSADFAETHTGTAGTNSYIGVYGNAAWPQPVNAADSGAPGAPVFNIRFTIVEDTFDGSPPATYNADKLGTIEVDGGKYDVYHTVQKPGVYYVFSIRQTPRHCGHISISEHISKWTDLNALTVGLLKSVGIRVEVEGGTGSTGSIDFTTAELTAD